MTELAHQVVDAVEQLRTALQHAFDGLSVEIVTRTAMHRNRLVANGVSEYQADCMCVDFHKTMTDAAQLALIGPT